MKKVFIMCSGVGHIGRGYESFSRELFENTKTSSALDVFLVKGAGVSSEKEKSIFCFKRTNKIAKIASKLFGRSAYEMEQLSFFLFSIPLLKKEKPAVILYSDFFLGVLLWHFRKFLRFKYTLLFSNGAPNGPPFSRCDRVQQLLPFYKEQAVAAGEDPSKHIVLPYAVTSILLSEEDFLHKKKASKRHLGLEERVVILCVAAINDSHKRITYLLEEVHLLGYQNIFLCVLGQKNEESDTIIQHGNHLFGENWIAMTLPANELAAYYLAADLFVLPSLTEGLPRVMLEAMSFGLPVLSHNYVVSKEVLGENGYFADFTKKGELASLLKTILIEKELFSNDKAIERRNYIQEKFSWQALSPAYIQMFLNA